MKKIFSIGIPLAISALVLLIAPTPGLAATVNVCPINGSAGIFKATGPITVSDRVMDTPAFAGDPTGSPSEGPFWPAQ